MIDLIVVFVSLLFTLIVGIYQGRGIKSFKNFSIADRNYSTAVLVATITATFLSGSAALGNAEKTFRYGLIFLLVPLGDVISTFIIARVVAPRIDRFIGCISIGDMMGSVYGKKAQIITGIGALLKSIVGLGAQASSIGYIFYYFLGFSHLTGTLIGVAIIIIYSAAGGMKAVTITDVIQFITLMVAIPMICNIGLSKVGGYIGLIQKLPDSHKTIETISKKDLVRNIEMFLIFATTFIGPSTAPRLLMARNAQQATEAFTYSVFIYIIFYSLITFIGLSAKILRPDLEATFALPYIIDIMPHPFLRGIAIAGLLAIVMSTADSIVNVASITFVNDILVPLSKRDFSDNTKLKIARYSTVFIGIFSTIAALSFKSVLDIMILSCMFWGPIVVIPFLFATLGFKSDKKSFFISAIGGCTTVILWRVLKLQDYFYFTETLPGVIGNAIFYLGSHCYYKYIRPEKFEPLR